MNYSLLCRECGFLIENPKDSDYRVGKDGMQHFPYCPICRTIMFHKVISICAKGDYHHVSQSLAINPSQIEEHSQAFPDVNVLPDGKIEFNSFKQHDNYLKKTGFVKMPKRNKSLGKQRIF